jgi:hypothetical protein
MSGRSVLRAGAAAVDRLGLVLGLALAWEAVGEAEAEAESEGEGAASVACAVQPMADIMASTAVAARPVRVRVFLFGTSAP